MKEFQPTIEWLKSVLPRKYADDIKSHYGKAPSLYEGRRSGTCSVRERPVY